MLYSKFGFNEIYKTNVRKDNILHDQSPITIPPNYRLYEKQLIEINFKKYEKLFKNT